MDNIAHHIAEEIHGHTLALMGGVVFVIFFLFFLFLYSRKFVLPSNMRPNSRLPLSDISISGCDPWHKQPRAQDTVFVLPDISGYTRYVTLNKFAVGHAQYIIFKLLNAMIDAVGDRLELSKIEGDAALFMANASSIAPVSLGDIIVKVFHDFDQAKSRLMRSNLCPCTACRHICDLDIKVFVHRGEAMHFRFRGATDVFGINAAVLHQMMNNQIQSRRYVMVTGTAESSVALPISGPNTTTTFSVEGLGAVSASVQDIPHALPAIQATMMDDTSPRHWRDFFGKLNQNISSIWISILGARRPQGDKL